MSGPPTLLPARDQRARTRAVLRRARVAGPAAAAGLGEVESACRAPLLPRIPSMHQKSAGAAHIFEQLALGHLEGQAAQRAEHGGASAAVPTRRHNGCQLKQ